MKRSTVLKVLLLATLCLLVVLPVGASAACGHWDSGSGSYVPVTWLNGYDSGFNHRYGTYGHVYVKDDRIHDCSVVTSLYVYQTIYSTAQPNFTEVGVYDEKRNIFGNYNSVQFTSFKDAGIYYGPYTGPYLARPSWPRMSVRNVTVNNKYSARWLGAIWNPPSNYTGPTIYFRTYTKKWSGGESLTSTERFDTGDNAYAYYKSLQRRNSTGSWSNWTNLQGKGETRIGYAPTELPYGISKMSNTKHQVVRIN